MAQQRKPQLQVQGDYPNNARVIDVATREVLFTAQGEGAWKAAQDYYRANSKRWREDKPVDVVECEILADAARPINDADWGSDRQVEAENRLFEFVRSILSDDEFERLEAFCLKATSEEMIDEALLLVVTKGS
jgi:hypothetical protein